MKIALVVPCILAVPFFLRVLGSGAEGQAGVGLQPGLWGGSQVAQDTARKNPQDGWRPGAGAIYGHRQAHGAI
jgi:hypothetical protein